MPTKQLQGVDAKQVSGTLPPRSQWLYMGACSIETTPFMSAKTDVQACKEVCNHCPVQDLCLRYAIANDERYGIWGGLTRRERLQVLKENPDLCLNVPVEFRLQYQELDGRVKRHKTHEPQSPPPRNPALDYQFDQGFLDLIDSINLA